MALSDLVRKVGRGTRDQDEAISEDDAMDIIEFIESPQGLRFAKAISGSSLFPVQKFILKMFYNLPLDDTDHYIRVPRSWRHIGSSEPGAYFDFTEVEYLDYLYKEGRCNIQKQDHDRREMILPIGRRSGKSTISAMIAAYETYKLLRKYNPQQFYGTPEGAPVQICSIATSREQAAILYKEVRRHFNNCQFFSQFLESETQTEAKFYTPRDLETGAKPSLRLTFYSAVAKGVRGAANIAAIMDEVAFFNNSGQASSYEVYQALSPSLAQFSPKDPKDPSKPIGNSHGRMIMISSPYAREGLFYDQYELALSGTKGAKNLLMIQAPTWEVNPTIPFDYFESEYEKSPVVFWTEFGAQFTDKVRSWIERDEDLQSCINPESRPILRGRPRERHFMGLDLAPRGDRTVVTLTKIEDEKIKLVYHEQWQAKHSWYDLNPHLEEPFLPYCLGMESIETLEYDEIANWIKLLTKKFFITEGYFDQYEGISFEQSLAKLGISHIKSKRFTRKESSDMYQAFKILMLNDNLDLYDYVLADDTGYERQGFSPYLQELMELQGHAKGKHLMVVQAPQVAGKHDDFSDSLVRSVWLAAEKISRRQGASSSKYAPPGMQTPQITSRTATQFQRKRRRRHNYQSKRR